jgi:DNA primase
MSKYISDDTLSLIKDRLSVSEVVGRRVTLKQKGKDYLGLCPFHKEKTPSFTVNDQKGFYHCFGCGVHGDIFKFLTEYEKMTFPEAVEQCAAEAGVALPEADPQYTQVSAERDTLFDLLSQAGDLFKDSLYTGAGKQYLQYLEKRGISNESIKLFSLGFSAKGRLLQFFNTRSVSADLLERAGLVNHYDGRIKEKFVDRLIFPIFDEKKRVVGFGGRTLNDAVQPKYLNSAENEVFHKGSLLYGIHQIDPKITSTILVEGYLDVIAMEQGGFKNALAPMGTSITTDQAKKILKYFKTIHVAFDGDAAGFKAMHRAAEVFMPLLMPGVELFFVQLPNGQDPHSMMTLGHEPLLRQKIDAPLNLIQFLIRYETAVNPGTQPSALALQRKNILKSIEVVQDPFLRSLYKDEVYKAFRRNRSSTMIQPMANQLPTTVSVQTIYETILIQSFLLYPGLYEGFMDRLYVYPLGETTQKLFREIESYLFLGQPLEFSSIVTYIKQRMPAVNIDHLIKEASHVHAPFLSEPLDETRVRQGIESILECFDETMSLESHIQEAQEQFKQSQSLTDWERLRQLMAQKQQLNSGQEF